MIKMERFQRTRVKICAIQYTGCNMDEILSKTFKEEFQFAYDYQQCRYLITAHRGLKNPHTRDWLIFDEKGRDLIDVMPDEIFRQTYEKTDSEEEEGRAE